jgi:hypothetical protein
MTLAERATMARAQHRDSVGHLIKELRKMHGHLSAKDRAVIVKTIGALGDLAVQLHNATHRVPFQGQRPDTV